MNIFQVKEGPGDMGATSIQEMDTELDRDAQAVFERKLQTQKVNKKYFILYL